MKKIRAAVVGYGNIGRFTIEALEAAPDFEIAGVVRRQGDKDKPLELTPYEVVDDIQKLNYVPYSLHLLVSALSMRRRSRSLVSTLLTVSTSTLPSSITARSRWKTTKKRVL